MRVHAKLFKATLKTWEELFTEAADFAGELAPENLINISHSDHGGTGIVTVWYWK